MINAPVLLDVIGGNENLVISWEAVTGNIGSYLIRYGTAPGNYSGSHIVLVSELVDAGSPSFTLQAPDATLTNNTTYWVSIAAVGIDPDTGLSGESLPSNELYSVVRVDSFVSQPSNFQVASGDSTVVLSWDLPDITVDGYIIEYTTDGSDPRVWNGTGAIEGNSPITIGNANLFQINGLLNNDGSSEPYYFRVTAYRGQTYSHPTEEEIGVPQAGITTPVIAKYVRLTKEGGNRLLGVALEPNTISSDAVAIMQTWGGTTIAWKAVGSSTWTTRLAAFGTANKTIEPMEAVFVNTAAPVTKILTGTGWKE